MPAGGPVTAGALEGQEEMKLLPPPTSHEGSDAGGGDVPAMEELSEDEKAALEAEEEALGPGREETPEIELDRPGEAGTGVLPQESRPRPPPRGRSRRSGSTPGFRAKGSDVSSGSGPSADEVPEIPKRSMKPVGPPGVMRKEPPVEAAPEVEGPDEDDELFDL